MQGDVAKKSTFSAFLRREKSVRQDRYPREQRWPSTNSTLLEEITEEEFHQEFNTNVLGLILATQEALKHFGKDGGTMINISSLATSLTPPAMARFIAEPKAPSTRSRARWRKNSARKRFGSTRSILERSRPKVIATWACLAAISRSRRLRRRRWVASGNRATLHPSRCFSPHPRADGSRARRCASPEVCGKRVPNELLIQGKEERMTATEPVETFKRNLQTSARKIRHGLNGRVLLGTLACPRCAVCSSDSFRVGARTPR